MTGILTFALAVGLVLLIYSGFWWLWCWALSQLWPDGPAQIIAPGFWLFVAVAVLLSFIGTLLFKKKD